MSIRFVTFAIVATAAALMRSSPLLAQTTYSVSSPDRRIEVRVTVKGQLRYAVSFQGKQVVLESPFGLEFRGAPPLRDGLVVVETNRQSIHASWENPLGKRRHVVEDGNELKLALVERAGPKRRVDFVLRAYDDGVAFRYRLPRQDGVQRFILTKEDTLFRFAGDPTVWAANYGGYASAQESEFRKQPMSDLSADQPYGTPLLIQSNSGCFVAITEADVQDWAGMYLSGTAHTEGDKLIETPVIRGGDPPRRLQVSVAGRKRLRLVVGDGGDDFTFDHADWGGAKLITSDGTEVRLDTLTPISSAQGFGSLQVDKSVGGAPPKIGATSFAHGLGSHSRGEIVYDLGGKYARFEAEVGIDAETQGKGSVTFSVYASDNRAAAESSLVTRLAPRRDGAGLVQSETPRNSPWRVLLIGRRPGDLVESDTILNLSEPCAIGDASWVKPGKCAWDHWWSGDVRMDTPTEKQYIQFAADMGFPYQLVDWQWYGPFGTPASDITRVNPNVDMPELLRFAKERKVRLFVWLHSSDVDRFLKSGRLDDAFALYNRWGLAGVKIDFMDHDDQDAVNWYYTIVRMAAQHRLMVDFHGAYKPTGMQRAFPNQITREGVMGEEYDKFSARVTPEHDCTLPFTRMLAGPMDYTPGGFLNRGRDRWKQALPTQVQGTRCHELAKFVIFDSPLTVLCDHPDNYRDQPGLEFLRVVPTVWDDTRIVDGFPGDFVISARRSGRDWFVGGMTNWDARTIEIPLKFLGAGRYDAVLFQDAPEADADAERLTESRRTVTAKDTLTIRLASGGGVAIHFVPK